MLTFHIKSIYLHSIYQNCGHCIWINFEFDIKYPGECWGPVASFFFYSKKTSFLAIISQVEETCCPGNGSHPIIHFQMTIKRKSIYYDYIVIAPTIMLCILTLASFWLPCHHGEKIAIGLTVFLTLYVLQLLIAENVPDTNTTPVLGSVWNKEAYHCKIQCNIGKTLNVINSTYYILRHYTLRQNRRKM